jgi:hypothetical protein
MFHGRFSAESEAGFYKLISRVPDGKITKCTNYFSKARSAASPSPFADRIE